MSLSVFDRDFNASACPICQTHCKGHASETGWVFPELKPPKEPIEDKGKTIRVEDEPIS